MSIFETFRIALSALATNKLRSLLTMLGIIIGTSAVIAMQSIGSGFRHYLEREYDRLGAGVFYILPSIDENDASAALIPRLTAEDARAIMEPGAAPAVATIATEYSGGGNVVGGGREKYWYTAVGVTPNYFTIGEQDLGAGRFFSDDEERERARVALIGSNVAQSLFGGALGALDQRITVEGVTFAVIGVLTTRPSQAARGLGSFNDPRDSVYIPYQTARDRLFRNRVSARQDVTQVIVKARSTEQVGAAIEQVTRLLRERHRLTYQPNDFRINNPQQAASESQAGLAGFSAFLVIIGGIALLVGGIGIMNIMLVSVIQRTREIGLRKAVGAQRRDILIQFLAEALVLCLVGGAIGIATGYALSLMGTLVMTKVFLIEGAQAVVDLSSVMLATAISALIGLCFGFWPAWRAARMHPIHALRSE